MTSPRGHELDPADAYDVYGEDSVELPDGRESYLALARAVIDSLDS